MFWVGWELVRPHLPGLFYSDTYKRIPAQQAGGNSLWSSLRHLSDPCRAGCSRTLIPAFAGLRGDWENWILMCEQAVIAGLHPVLCTLKRGTINHSSSRGQKSGEGVPGSASPNQQYISIKHALSTPWAGSWQQQSTRFYYHILLFPH